MARRKSTIGARARQGNAAGIGAAPPSPYLQRHLAFFDPLDETTLAQLEAQVDWLMQDIGIAFRDDPKALEVWRKAGARPVGHGRVGFLGKWGVGRGAWRNGAWGMVNGAW